MENTLEPNEKDRGKTVLAIIMVVTIILPILFFTAIQLFHISGLPAYFMQLGLYLIYYLLAFWGLKKERIALPVSARLVLEAVGWLLVGWLVYVLFIHILGLAKLPEEIQTLRNIPAWEIWAQILSIWFFVGMAEEVLFRGYFLASFRRYFTKGTSRRRMIIAILFTSAFFSLWHLPVRITWIVSGEMDLIMLILSLLTLFIYGVGFAYLFVRTQNIILVGLVHGLMDYPLIGQKTQLSFFILLAAIGCVEIARLIMRKKGKTLQMQ